MFLTDFQIIRPPHESPQEACLEWLIAAHVQSEKFQGKEGPPLIQFETEFRERLARYGCKPGPIEKRGHILSEPLHQDWDKMVVYRLSEKASGEGLGVRAKQFSAFVDAVFEEFYENEQDAPDDLIHVTCTGYVSPSGAQKLVSKKHWGDQTTVTHAYHMGCYGSLPAIRMGRGFLTEDAKRRADIVHTEVCSLHSNPSLHGIDQLVSQSLFADGFIKYSVQREVKGDAFFILTIKEEIIPQSTKAMTWDVMDWGFQMSLAKEVPVLITRALKGYLERLASKAKLNLEDLLKNGYFAIHPGGPKILQHVQQLLELSDNQMKYSYQILRQFGNMSSGTLPHIWKEIAEDEKIPTGAHVVSLAFGPGLTIAGAILEKRCGGQR